MARGCSESDSEEERHDRFRSERSNTSQNASKSLFNSGFQTVSKARSPIRRTISPFRRDHRSPSSRSRSRSERSKERKKSKERRESKEKYKKDTEKSRSTSKVKESRYSEEDNEKRRSTSKVKESRYSEVKDSEKSESKHRSESKGSRRSRSKDKKKKRDCRKSNSDNAQTNDTFLLRFERRRPSVEKEIVESTIIYRDSSPEIESQSVTKNTHDSKSYKKEKKRKKSQCDTEEGELISEEENNCFGPILPPRVESEEEDGEVKDKVAEGPALPPGFSSGVPAPSALPEQISTRKRSTSQEKHHNKFQRTSKSGSDEERKDEDRVAFIGPSLPPRECRPPVEKRDGSEEALYGPALPPPPASVPEEEDDPLIGPLPRGMVLDDTVQRILEERAQSLRKQMENKETGGGDDDNEQNRRENWMVELPEVKTATAAHLGLGPRKFKTREGPDMSDRSSWTSISGKPTKQEDKETSDDVQDTKSLEVAARNEEMERRAKESSKHRDKSLLDMHQKELKKKRKKELENSGGKVERRPFSREIDLQANRFDESRTKSIISKAQLLNSRFSTGESKYL